MKICKIYIKDFQQFKDIELDFTHPETGEPLDKICFIGRNGTGKSTILNLINTIIGNRHDFNILSHFPIDIKFKFGDKFYFYSSRIDFINNFDLNYLFEQDLNENEKKNFVRNFTNSVFQKNQNNPKIISDLSIKLREVLNSKLSIFIPSESSTNPLLILSDVPKSSLNNALAYFNNFPNNHIISSETVNVFWNILIFLIKKRENEREEFENLSSNLNKTKKQLITEFDSNNPKILDKLALIWNRILDKANLEFDVKGASNPIQLTDNLKAYIKLKSTGETIKYNQLSTGIRNFIFRLGHIYSLYFNREIKNGFLLVDEPENSLYPDFLFDLIETYLEVIKDKNGENNTQFFVATHNPIIAAQFAPYERIVLDWNNDGTVNARKGTAPTGDDPNDVLVQDFELKRLMGKEGQKMWEKYVDLKKKLHNAKTNAKKDILIAEISKIGSLYHF